MGSSDAIRKRIAFICLFGSFVQKQSRSNQTFTRNENKMLNFTSVSCAFGAVDPAFNICRLFLSTESTCLRLFSIVFTRERTRKHHKKFVNQGGTFREVLFVETIGNLENQSFVDVVVYFYVFKFFLKHATVEFYRFSSYPGKNHKTPTILQRENK